MAWDTAANIIDDAGKELSLWTSDYSGSTVATLYTSTDQHVVLLRMLLKGLGQDLARQHDWSQLIKTHTFSTANGTAAYDPPTDYLRTINRTHWNRTQQMPLGGPIGSAGWQQLQALSNTASAYKLFRVTNDQLSIHPTPSATETVAFEYFSRYWVRRNWQASTAYMVGDVVVNDTAKVYTADTAGTSASSGGPTGTSTNITDGTARWDYTSALAGANGTIEYPTWGGDTLLFDRRMLVIGLQLYFKGKRGFNALMEDAQFANAVAASKGADAPAPVLALAGGRGVHLIDDSNLPDTGVGS